MADPAIRTRDLTKMYGPIRGVEGVTLDVHRGEIFGFLGPNGAGKTTTIRLLLDLIRATRGGASVAGFDCHRDSLEVRQRTGYLPGDLDLPPRATAGAFLAHLARLRDGAGRERIGAIADRLGLELDRRIGDLSTGNRQKIGVVAAFMHDPELLILDEPTSGLDPLRQRDVEEMMRERAAVGRTVFLSSHELDQVEDVADRVGIIREGRLIAVEEISALKRRAIRRVEVRLADDATVEGLERLAGVSEVEAGDGVVRLRVEGPMDGLVKELAHHRVETLTSETPDLDEIFLAYYRGPES